MHIGVEEVLPLWMLSTPDVGGLGWDIQQIGQVQMLSNPVWVLMTLPIARVPAMLVELDMYGIGKRHKLVEILASDSRE